MNTTATPAAVPADPWKRAARKWEARAKSSRDFAERQQRRAGHLARALRDEQHENALLEGEIARLIAAAESKETDR